MFGFESVSFMWTKKLCCEFSSSETLLFGGFALQVGQKGQEFSPLSFLPLPCVSPINLSPGSLFSLDNILPLFLRLK